MSAININKNNFQNEIMDSEKTVLLDFWAPWCAPCRMVVPIIEEIASVIKIGLSCGVTILNASFVANFSTIKNSRTNATGSIITIS